jgi:hypothetical protein
MNSDVSLFCGLMECKCNMLHSYYEIAINHHHHCVVSMKTRSHYDLLHRRDFPMPLPVHTNFFHK